VTRAGGGGKATPTLIVFHSMNGLVFVVSE
jgi:hypothetical protein